jgi:hypothetical protein
MYKELAHSWLTCPPENASLEVDSQANEKFVSLNTFFIYLLSCESESERREQTLDSKLICLLSLHLSRFLKSKVFTLPFHLTVQGFFLQNLVFPTPHDTY